MNKILKGLLITALAVSAAQVSAHTNKTFLMPRPVGVNLPMEWTSFDTLVGHKSEDRFGGSFAVTGFYQASSGDDDIAKYFLFKDKSAVKLSNGLNNAGGAAVTLSPADLDLRYLIHQASPGALNVPADGSLPVTIGLDPEQTAYGVRFDYHQDLSKILKGLYLYANLPIAHVENDLGLSVKSENGAVFAQGVLTDNANGDSVQTTVTNFFNGTFTNVATTPTAGNFVAGTALSSAANNQIALTNAKIAGARSETGVADIDLGLGYKFLNKEAYHAAIAIAVTIPTGNEADGTYAFQPIVGNGEHFGLGGDLCALARVWGDMEHNIKIKLAMKYRYLFENTEKRTLGIKNRNFGQYQLLVPFGIAPATAGATGLTPAANITTLNVDVTPGSQFDGLLGLTYNNGGFAFDFGYNMYFREAESLTLKDTFADGKWAIAALNLITAGNAFSANANQNQASLGTLGTDATVAGAGSTAWTAANAATANTAYATAAALNIRAQDAAFGVNTGSSVVDALQTGGLAASVLTKANLDFDAASTPSQFTHSLYAGLGYCFKEWETPVMLGLGGKYEWVNENSALEQWGIWGKIGIGF